MRLLCQPSHLLLDGQRAECLVAFSVHSTRPVGGIDIFREPVSVTVITTTLLTDLKAPILIFGHAALEQ